MIDLIFTVLALLATVLLLRLLARKYPATRSSGNRPVRMLLQARHGNVSALSSLGLIALAVVIAGAMAWPLDRLAEWQAQRLQDRPDTLVFFMGGEPLWAVSFFPALLLAGLLLERMLRFVLRHRYAEFERLQALSYGFDAARLNRVMAVIICCAFAPAAGLLLNTTLVASLTELRVNPLLGVERRYAYSEVSEILRAPAYLTPIGTTVRRHVYMVRFKDGSALLSKDVPEREVSQRPRLHLLDVIAERSGIAVTSRAVLDSDSS